MKKKKKKKKFKLKLKVGDKFSFLGNKFFWIFLGFFLLGVFLRSYNFEPWLHFELDQARDAVLIDESLNGGFLNLPLLGPRAGGSYLRLGPIFYYIEYGFSFLVNNSVVGSALASVFFSIFSMIAMYFFLRRFFNKTISIATGAIFSTSLFLITYARFAWNPNLLPFFVIAFLYTLLRAVDIENEKKQGIWLLGSAFLFGILSQLHFLAMVVIFIVAVIFLIFRRPKIKMIFWAGSVLIVLFLNLPLVINDIKSGGANIKQLTGTVEEKSESKADYDFIEKTIKSLSENSLSYWTIVTGSQRAELPRIATDFKNKKLEVDCKWSCRQNLSKGIMASIFFGLGVLILIIELFIEKEPRKKDFIILNLMLFFVSFGIFTVLAYDISPRFYLIVINLPFVFWGLIVYEITRIIKIKNLSWAFAIIFVSFNLYFVTDYFKQLAVAKSEQVEIGTDNILRQKTRVTWEQQNMIADYMEKIYKKNNYAVLYHAQSEFHRAFSYLLDKKKIPRDGISMGDDYKICRRGNYFLIVRTQSDKNSFVEYFNRFSVLEEKSFGTLTIYHLMPKENIINCEVPDQTKFRTYKDEGGAVSKRYIWKEVLDIK
jgi:4-amino-4-deoxy-L-arabinose transferase-like glycosyltransferase